MSRQRSPDKPPREHKRPSLPPGLTPRRDLTVRQTEAFQNESETTVRKKILARRYRSYKDGNKRLVEIDSILEDRARCIAAGPQLSPPSPPGVRRPVGRPRKSPVDAAE